MFSVFFRFELWFWLKTFMLWIFLGVLTMIMASVLLAEEAILEDVFFGNTFRNSPFVIQRLYGISAVFGCLMVAAFVNSAAIRDFSYNTHQLIFTKPIRKQGYLLGRFFGAAIISLIPMLGVSLAVFVSQWWSPGPHWGPTYLKAHLSSILIFAIPNTFFISAVVFSIAVWTRSSLASFMGILGLMVALTISGALIGNLANAQTAALLEPFGQASMEQLTKYWTIADKNTQSVGLTGILLWNRLLWTGIGCLFLGAACLKFSFTTKIGWLGKFTNLITASIKESLSIPFHTSNLPSVQRQFGFRFRVVQLARMTWLEIWSTIKSAVFICLIVGVALSVLATLSTQATAGFGVSAYPVTFTMVMLVREALSDFQIVLITFFAGVFVWKERDAKLDEIIDSLPFPTWLSFCSKSLALLVVIGVVAAIGIVSGLSHQLASLFFDFQIGVYFQELLLIDLVQMSCLIGLAMLFHVISPNKYIGYFAFVVFLIANALAWPLLGIESEMVKFGSLTSYTYSDLFGRQPYSSAIFWFGAFWLLLTMLLGVVAILLWPRGRERGWGKRLQIARPRWTGGLRVASVGLFLAWLVCGGWVFWNTQILNTYRTAEGVDAMRADYELSYREYANQPSPRVTDIFYQIDLFPEKRGLMMKGKQSIVNAEETDIESVVILIADQYETDVEIEGASIVETNEEVGALVFRFDPPMQPGTTREMTFTVSYEAVGFENSVQIEQIVQNGTFFDNSVAPQIGYQPRAELADEKKRKKFGLTGTSVLPLEPENLAARRNNYVSNNSDWVNVETIISTSGDQIAVAPGSIQKTWEKDGRRYFHYKLDHPSLNMYSFVSARYKVAVREWNGVQIEVYYHPDHEWNVDLMLRSIRKSLEYYTEAFGPYQHKQARIIEFPRVAGFAQAFPGTMPYSEGIGFIADLKNPDDIDMVYYIVAHEMAHQWWAHQVIGANMQGATLLSETLAQYSALMVMEKEYGRDMMRKFLKYEMDTYLRTRGQEKDKEYPLKEVKSTQGYIHYNKGSVAMYHLKETIGEDKLNDALRSVVEKFGYSDGPYPTSVDLIDALRLQTPQEHWGLLSDLFEKITLFENRTVTASYSESPEGKFLVTIEVECKKLYAQADGTEIEAKLDDWIEIGAFAKPAGGRKFGETLHRERVHVSEPTASFTFEVDQMPHRAGVDPFSLLIDRNTFNNMKPVELTIE